jgi:biopolymer transport protein ExbD
MIAPNALKLLLPSSNSQTQAKPIANVFIKDLNNGIYEYGVGTTKLFDYKPAESEFDKGKIELAIKKEIAGQEEPCIALHVDKSVPMEEVVRVMNIAKDNNWKLILATKPIKN